MKLLALHLSATTARLTRACALALALVLLWLGLQAPTLAKLPATAFPRLDTIELALETQAAANLTLSLPGPAGVAQTYIVLTTRPDLLQVPNRVTLPVGARSVNVPIQALAAGVGLVRVIANTRQLAATVTVIDGVAQLRSVQPLPATVVQGGNAQLLFELSAVPRDDVTLTLNAIPHDALSLPAQVIVPAGSRRAEVAVQALQAGVHTVRAELGAGRLEATLRVTPAAPAALSLQPSRSDVEAGAEVTLNVLLNGFASTPVDVALSATPADLLQLPARVSIAAGADRAELAVRALKPGTAQISAEAGARSATAELVVRDAVGAAMPPQLNLRPPELALAVGATGSVSVELDAVRAYDQVLAITLAQQVPSSGSGNVVTVPPSLVIAAGQRSASFRVAAVALGTAQVALRPGNSTEVTTLAVTVADQTSQGTILSPAQQTLPKGAVGQAVVQIAPDSSTQNDIRVSADPADVVSLPATVTVVAGQTQATVALAARREGEAQIRTSLNGSSTTAQVTVTAAAIEELRPPASYKLGVGSIARLPVQALLTDGSVIDDPAGVQFSSDKPEVLSVDATGALTGVAPGLAEVEVRLADMRLRVPVTVVEQPPLQLSPANAEVEVGASVVYTVSTATPTPVGGLVVELSYSGQGGLELPSSVSILANATSTTFTATAQGIGTVTLRAEASGRQPATATLIKKLPVLAITSDTPLRGPAGTVVTITGTGFDPVVANNTVYVGDVALELVSASATQLVARIPVSAVTGDVRVVNALGSVTGPAFTVEQSQDFNLSASPAESVLLAGTSTTLALQPASIGTRPYTGLLDIEVLNLPSGITAKLQPATLNTSQSGAIVFSADTNTAPGRYDVLVQASGLTSSGRSTKSASATLVVQSAASETGVKGRFVTPDGHPIAGVSVSVDATQTSTDTAGNFLLTSLQAGPVTLRFDATPANPLYPIWPYSITLTSGQVAVVPDWTINPPPAGETFVPIANATQLQTISDPRFPDFAITLPVGASIIGWDGVPKTRIAVERLAMDKLPVPMPPVPIKEAYQLYFGTPMGGIPSQPIPVTLPNVTGLEPGQQTEIWYYDGSPMGGTGEWKLAGLGTISGDGTRVVSDPGVGIPRFCGVCGLFAARCPPLPSGNQASADSCGSGGGGGSGSDNTAGNPVELYSGYEMPNRGGLTCGGFTPMEIGLSYHPVDAFQGRSGLFGSAGEGWVLDYDVVLADSLRVPGSKRLLLPPNSRINFAQQPDGNYTAQNDPRFYGAVLTLVSNSPREWQLRFKDGRKWRFGMTDAVGMTASFLIETIDAQGNATQITRRADRKITAIGTAQRRYTLSYGANDFVQEIRDPADRTMRMTYTANNRIETLTDAEGGVTRFTYVDDSEFADEPLCPQGTDGRRIKTIRYPGYPDATENFHGTSRRVLRQVGYDGREHRFSYRLSGACVTHVSTPGVRCAGPACPTLDSWDNYQAGWRVRGGQVIATTVTLADGSSTTKRYNAIGLTTERIDANAQSLVNLRDANNRVTRRTDALGRVTRFAYDAQGNATQSVDALGRITDTTYSSLWSKPTSITRHLEDGTAVASQFTYDPNTGNLTRTTDPLGHTTIFAYTVRGQLSKITDALGNVSELSYNDAGDLTSVTDPLGNTRRVDYDNIGRAQSSTDPLVSCPRNI